MLHSELPSSRWRIIAPAAVLLAAALSCRAQFSGGVADGYSSSDQRFVVPNGSSAPPAPFTASVGGGDGYGLAGLVFSRLNGAVSPTVPFLSGGNGGDGYSGSGAGFIFLNGSSLPGVIYAASTTGGDGYSISGLINRPLNGAAAALVSFKGGSGDGYETAGLENLEIDPGAAALAVFTGGAGDGYHGAGLAYATLDGNRASDVMFTAGTAGGDGYDAGGLRYQSLIPGVDHSEIFSSSVTGGDGYDTVGLAFLPLNGEMPQALAFTGSSGDGYSRDGFLYTPLTPSAVLPAELYAGNAGDGYDVQGLPFVQYLGGGEAASGITFAGWRFSRFSAEEIEAGLANPGVDADGDGLANLLEFALGGDPRVSDAFSFGPQFRLSNLADYGLPALPDRHLTALVRRNPLALDAGLEIEVSDDVSVLWSVNEVVMVESTPSAFIVRDQFGIQSAPRRSMRLKATLQQ